jgi:methyl-accepting chemotaxis protein
MTDAPSGMSTSSSNEKQAARSLFGGLQSLERRLILALLVVGIVPLLIMAALSYWQAQRALRDSVESELASVVSLNEDRVERWIETRQTDAKTYSSMDFVTGDSENSLELGLEVITSGDGSVIAERAARNVMQDILASTGDTYDAIYLTHPDGRVKLGTQRIPGVTEDAPDTYQGGYNETHSFASDSFFIQALEQQNEGGYFRSDVIAYPPFGVTTMFIVHTVNDASTGQYVGTIILQVSPNELQSLAESFADGDGSSYLRSGDFLVSAAEIVALENPQAVKDSQSSSGIEELDGFSGQEVLGSWQANPNLGFVVFAQIPKSEALSAINGLGLILLILSIIFFISVGVVAYVVARRLTAPIKRLTNAALEISKGSLDTRVSHKDVSRTDELGALSQAFNDMTDNLRVQVYDATQNRQYLEDVLTSYMKFVERVSRGDLTARLSLNGQTGPNLIVANVRVDQDDNLLRLGYNLNRMVEALHSMASQTRDVARSLSEAAAQILDTSTSQIASTTQQDAAVSQTTSTVAEVRATVAETAERAQMVAEAAQQSVEISRQGQHAVAETIEGMNVIRSRVESIAENILMLSERTTQIGDIIATVNAIADQSKMLALNASIEAARAGEEGRGFAVVAMEVRNLAEQSREATAQVRDILSEIQQATNTAVMVTEEGTKGVDLGVQLVDRAGRAIRELAAKLEDASQSAMQIAASTRQQSQGMDQLTSAMSSIKTSTGSTATSMQASQRKAKDLNEMARQMEAAISAYKL